MNCLLGCSRGNKANMLSQRHKKYQKNSPPVPSPRQKNTPATNYIYHLYCQRKKVYDNNNKNTQKKQRSNFLHLSCVTVYLLELFSFTALQKELFYNSFFIYLIFSSFLSLKFSYSIMVLILDGNFLTAFNLIK